MNTLFKLWAIVLMAVILLVAGGCSSKSSDASGRTEYKVIRVIDGDTIKIDFKGRQENVRFIGIDTPEMRPRGQKGLDEPEPYAFEAKEFVAQKIGNNCVYLEFDVEKQDKYGRLLAYVYVDNEMLNEQVLAAGLAQMATYPPNVKYVGLFRRSQKEAREKGIGIWGD